MIDRAGHSEKTIAVMRSSFYKGGKEGIEDVHPDTGRRSGGYLSDPLDCHNNPVRCVMHEDGAPVQKSRREKRSPSYPSKKNRGNKWEAK